MISRVYSIYDIKAAIYIGTFFESNNAVAMRRFSDLVNDPRSPFFKHPEDYILFCLGAMDDESGRIEGHDPVNLAVASDVKIRSDENA